MAIPLRWHPRGLRTERRNVYICVKIPHHLRNKTIGTMAPSSWHPTGRWSSCSLALKHNRLSRSTKYRALSIKHFSIYDSSSCYFLVLFLFFYIRLRHWNHSTYCSKIACPVFPIRLWIYTFNMLWHLFSVLNFQNTRF